MTQFHASLHGQPDVASNSDRYAAASEKIARRRVFGVNRIQLDNSVNSLVGCQQPHSVSTVHRYSLGRPGDNSPAHTRGRGLPLPTRSSCTHRGYVTGVVSTGVNLFSTVATAGAQI